MLKTIISASGITVYVRIFYALNLRNVKPQSLLRMVSAFNLGIHANSRIKKTDVHFFCQRTNAIVTRIANGLKIIVS